VISIEHCLKWLDFSCPVAESKACTVHNSHSKYCYVLVSVCQLPLVIVYFWLSVLIAGISCLAVEVSLAWFSHCVVGVATNYVHCRWLWCRHDSKKYGNSSKTTSRSAEQKQTTKTTKLRHVWLARNDALQNWTDLQLRASETMTSTVTRLVSKSYSS